jgi:DNA (cytosine-5)-methyltransferase 1
MRIMGVERGRVVEVVTNQTRAMEKVKSFDSTLSVTDLFCGCGGSSTGAVNAGMEVNLALNHWEKAIETHSKNHPDAAHDCVNVAATRPDRYPKTRILWASPACQNHSLAKNSKYKEENQTAVFEEKDPSSVRSRCTMWDVVRWTEWHDYEAVIVENVPDAAKWELFGVWLQSMHKLGYEHEIVWLNSMFAYPTPQSRNRMYVVFWREGNEAPNLEIRPPAYCKKCREKVRSVQRWRDTKRGRERIGLRYGVQYEYRCPKCEEKVEPYRFAAFNVIDWTVEAPKIGNRDQPLAEKTMERIEEGLEKYGGDPLVIEKRKAEEMGDEVGLVHPAFLQKQNSGSQRPRGLEEPLGAQTTSLSDGLVSLPPKLCSVNYFDSRVIDSREEAYPTQTTQTKWAVVEPPTYLAKLHGTSGAEPISEPLGCVMAGGNHHALIKGGAFLSYYYSSSHQNSGLDEPAGTITTRDRIGLVEKAKEKAKDVSVEECRFRMLQPHEVKAAMAFHEGYEVTGNKKERVKQMGNAVTPPAAELLLERVRESLDK